MHNSHSSFELNFHLVFVTKCRREFFFFSQFDWLKACEKFSDGNLHFNKIGFAKNHVHLLVYSTSTEFNIAKFVNRIKTESSILFGNLYPLRWSGWQNGFFVSTVGKNSVRKVKKYLSHQS